MTKKRKPSPRREPYRPAVDVHDQLAKWKLRFKWGADPPPEVPVPEPVPPEAPPAPSEPTPRVMYAVVGGEVVVYVDGRPLPDNDARDEFMERALHQYSEI